jgi:hypothetical protein
LIVIVPAVRADQIFTATLSRSNEVPATGSTATGFITVDLHADLITVDVSETFTGLVAPASAAHIALLPALMQP